MPNTCSNSKPSAQSSELFSLQKEIFSLVMFLSSKIISVITPLSLTNFFNFRYSFSYRQLFSSLPTFERIAWLFLDTWLLGTHTVPRIIVLFHMV